MNYLDIMDCSVVDGEGIRVVLFVSGCSHHCIGCHNPESWDPDNGKEFTDKTVRTILKLLARPYIDGLTISGGDPLFIDNCKDVLKLCKVVKDTLPNKTIWLYTGYTYEEIVDTVTDNHYHQNIANTILGYVDVLVDGKFILQERDITLPFRGSKNQRIVKLHDKL